jgi:hypothetical protein
MIKPWLMSFDTFGAEDAISISPADTFTYWSHASDPLILVPYNLIGPVSVIKVFNGNFDLIFLFYILLFLFALKSIYKYIGLNPFQFATFMFINPLIMFQFFAPNKEILIIISMLFIIIYIYSNKKIHLFLSLILAAFTKPEFFVLVLFFILIRNLNNKLRPIILIGMILFFTLFYSVLPNMESQSEVLLRGQTNASLGVTVFLQNLAVKYYLYPIVIVPRIFLTMFESSTFFIIISGIFFLLSLIKVFSKSRLSLNLNNDIYFIGCIFLIMVSIVPFPHHRYILPIYPLLLIFLLQPNLKNKKNSSKI